MEPVELPDYHVVEPLPIEAPQGIYGLSAHPLEKGEVWVQDVEVLGLGVQAGLGKGVDVAVGAFGVPWQVGMYTAEVGLSRPVSDSVTLRGTVGVGTILSVDGREAGLVPHPLGAAGGAFTWGERRRHISGSVRVGYGIRAIIGAGEVDAVIPVGKRGAVLLGVSDLVAFSFASEVTPWQALLAGGAYRFGFGHFSLDLGAQVAVGPSVAWGIIPVPTVAVRYGVAPKTDGR